MAKNTTIVIDIIMFHFLISEYGNKLEHVKRVTV